MNVLATFPEFRRLGIGGQLLFIAETKAGEAGAPALSVIVGSWKKGAPNACMPAAVTWSLPMSLQSYFQEVRMKATGY